MVKFLERSNDILTRKYYALSDIETMGVLPQLYKYYQKTGRIVTFLRRSLSDEVKLEAVRTGCDKSVERALQHDGLLAELISTDDGSVTSENISVVYAVSLCMPSVGFTCDDFLRNYMEFLRSVSEALYVFLGDLTTFCFDMSMGAFVTFLSKTFKVAAVKETTIALDTTLVPTSCSSISCKTGFLDICRQYLPYVHSVYIEAVQQGLTMDSIADSWWGCGRLGWLSTAGHATYQSKREAQDKLWVLLNDATRYLTSNAIGVLATYLKTFDLVLEVPIAE